MIKLLGADGSAVRAGFGGDAMDPYVSELRFFAFDWAPQGWQICDGSLPSLSQNEVLYSLIGTNYGGDGRSNFAVPKMPSPLGTQGRWCIALVGNYPQRP